ncbi:MAG: 50S ribosomal protein L21e [Candidatus Hodarchaeales archaeon]|jgi:large subunit ribosomal protein L21e
MPKSKGTAYRSRNILSKPRRKRGLPPLGSLLTEYAPGDKVVIVLEPSVQKGRPHRRFHGKVATVVKQRGRAYELRLKDGNKPKMLIVRPEHLRPHHH